MRGGKLSGDGLKRTGFACFYFLVNAPALATTDREREREREKERYI